MTWLMRVLNLWKNIPPDYEAAEKLAANRTFQKGVMRLVNLPRDVADFLVPPEEDKEVKQIEDNKNIFK